MNFAEIKAAFERMEQDLERLGEETVATKNWREELDGKLGTVGGALERMAALKQEVETEHGSLKERVEELESRRGTPGKSGESKGSRPGGVVLAERITNHKAFRDWKESGGQKEFEIPFKLSELKAPLTGSGSGSPSNIFPVAEVRLDQVFNDPRRPIQLLDVLPHVSMGPGNKVEYLRLHPAYTPNAQVQEMEGAEKAEAFINATLESVNVVTIAEWMPVSRQALDDVTMLGRWIQGLLIQSVRLKLEREIVLGSSKTPDGLNTAASAAVTTKTAANDRLGEVKAQLETVGWTPTVAILNPDDVFGIESERTDGSGDGQYVSPPSGGKFWGLTPAKTPVIGAGTGFVLDPSQVTIFDRETIKVHIGTIDRQLVENMVTILVEGRFAFALNGPSAVRKVSL